MPFANETTHNAAVLGVLRIRFALDGEQRAALAALAAAYAGPFLLLSCGALASLWRARWEPSRLVSAFAAARCLRAAPPSTAAATSRDALEAAEKSTALSTLRRASCCAGAAGAAAVLALLCVLAFGVHTAVAVRPSAVGLAWVTAAPAMLSLLWAALLWRARRWRGAGAPMALLGAAVTLLSAFEVAVVFSQGEWSFLAASWTFLGANALLVMQAAYELLAPRVQAREAWLGRLVKEAAADAHASAARVERRRRGSGGVVESDEVVVRPDDGDIAIARETSSSRRSSEVKTPPVGAPEHSRRALVAYLASLVPLGVYAIANFVLAAPGSDDGGPLLGVWTAGTVLLLDLAVFLMHRSGVLSRLRIVCTTVGIVRVGLVAFGARWWFVGTSVVYATTTATLWYKWVRRLSERPPGRASGNETRSRGCRCSISSLELADGARTPQAVVGLLTVAFGAAVAMVGVIRPGGFPLSRVPMPDADHDQWEFGVAALLFVLDVLAASAFVFLGGRWWKVRAPLCPAFLCVCFVVAHPAFRASGCAVVA